VIYHTHSIGFAAWLLLEGVPLKGVELAQSRREKHDFVFDENDLLHSEAKDKWRNGACFQFDQRVQELRHAVRFGSGTNVMRQGGSCGIKVEDLALAAFMMAKGHALLRANKQTNGRFEFWIDCDQARAGVLAIAYSNSELAKYDGLLRAIKKVINLQRCATCQEDG